MSNIAMSNQTDLDWLALNVHEWPEGKNFICYSRDHGYAIFHEHDKNCAEWFTKDQWLARRAELQGKPSWADAPEWANYLSIDGDSVWYWHEMEPKTVSGCEHWVSRGQSDIACNGVLLGDWRDTLERRPEAKTRAQAEADLVNEIAKAFKPFISIEDNQGQGINKDNSWFECGELLPPVGAWCEASCEGADPEKCRILAYHKTQVAVQWSQFNQGCLDVLEMPGWSFRPLRTEREKAIKEMKNHCPYHGSWNSTYRQFAEALYDAGYRKESK